MMRCGKGIGRLVVGCGMAAAMSGCVSLDGYRRLQATQRNLAAEKEALSKELFDTRAAIDPLRVRMDALERELATKDELLGNLRGENELLDEMRSKALSELEGLANQRPGDLTITAPKLPAPLDSALKQFADAHPSEVVYDAQRGTVKWKADLLFALGSDVVRETSMDALRQFSDIINSSSAARFEVIVVGHTDTRPISRTETKANHPTNWHLSAHRAIAVGNTLQKFAYPAQKISVMGCGEFRPVADNATPDGSSQNRRVEVYLVPKGTIVQTATRMTEDDERHAAGDASPE